MLINLLCTIAQLFLFLWLRRWIILTHKSLYIVFYKMLRMFTIFNLNKEVLKYKLLIAYFTSLIKRDLDDPRGIGEERNFTQCYISFLAVYKNLIVIEWLPNKFMLQKAGLYYNKHLLKYQRKIYGISTFYTNTFTSTHKLIIPQHLHYKIFF